MDPDAGDILIDGQSLKDLRIKSFIVVKLCFSYFFFHEVHAREAGYMLRYCIPGMILQCFNDQLKSYLVTLKCAVPFGMINIYNIILNITLSYYLVIQCNMPLLAFPVIKVVNEVNIALLSIYLFTFKIKPEVKVMPCWSIYKDNL